MKGFDELHKGDMVLPRRKKLRLSRAEYQQGNAFSITIGTYSRYPWFRLYPELASIAVQVLCHVGTAREAALYAWCIMPDHVHLLLQDNDLSGFVRLFKGKMTPKASSIEPGRKLWQRSFYDHGLRREESLSDIARYIWENPVRAGIIDNPVNYVWSGSLVWDCWQVFFGRR